MQTLKGAHGTTKINAKNIQKNGFKPSSDGIWGYGVYFFSESDTKKSQQYACKWIKSKKYHSEYNKSYYPVCLVADIDCSDDHYIDFEDFKDFLSEERRKIYQRYPIKEKRNEQYKKLYEQFLNVIIEKRGFKRNNIVIRVPIPFPKGSDTNNGYCIVVTNTEYIFNPPYEEEECK